MCLCVWGSKVYFDEDMLIREANVNGMLVHACGAIKNGYECSVAWFVHLNIYLAGLFGWKGSNVQCTYMNAHLDTLEGRYCSTQYMNFWVMNVGPSIVQYQCTEFLCCKGPCPPQKGVPTSIQARIDVAPRRGICRFFALSERASRFLPLGTTMAGL